MSIKYLLTIVATVLAAAPLMRAQDAASTPFQEPASAAPAVAPTAPPQQPPPPPAVTESPAATPAIAPVEKTPGLTEGKKTAPPAEQTTAAPAKGKREKAKSAAAEINQGSDASIRELEERWEKSLLTHDAAVLEKLLADDFVGTSSSGKIGNKSTMLAESRRDKGVYKRAVSRVSVHSFGSKVAVAVGVARDSGTDKAGKKFEHTYRFTDTWVNRDGKWRCVAAHATAFPDW